MIHDASTQAERTAMYFTYDGREARYPFNPFYTDDYGQFDVEKARQHQDPAADASGSREDEAPTSDEDGRRRTVGNAVNAYIRSVSGLTGASVPDVQRILRVSCRDDYRRDD
jgi:hypothetical protein